MKYNKFEITNEIKELKEEIKQKYDLQIEKLKEDCKKEILEKTQKLKEERKAIYYNTFYKHKKKENKRDVYSKELFGKLYKELNEEEKRGVRSFEVRKFREKQRNNK